MFVPVEVGADVCVGVGVNSSVDVMVLVGGWGVESSALAGLTLYCRIGQKINIVISSNMDDEVSTTPRENFMRGG